MKTRADWIWLFGVALASIGIAAVCQQVYGSTWLEMSAFVTSAIAVYLVVRENMVAWPLGIVSLALYTVFFYDARLFGDAYLQIVFIGAQVHGWFSWAKGGANESALRVSRASRTVWMWLSIAFAIGYALLVPILFKVEGKQPWVDGLTTAMSLSAQYMLNRKLIENWALWIVVDLIYVPWYWKLGYHATSILYVVFLALAVAGWLQWRKALMPSVSDPVLNP